ncbi:hypothetical protein ABT366_09605 [Streptomyces lydicus]
MTRATASTWTRTTTIAQALRLDVTDTARLGPDLRITATPLRPALHEEN